MINRRKWLRYLLGLFMILSFAFGIRLKNLTLIPVFADEAIYVRWSQVMRAVPTLHFLPLSDGKQPLFMWSVIPFLKIFNDPLFAGRLVSVICGTGTIVVVALTSLFVFGSFEISLISASLIAFSPFNFFFDRFALADSMLTFWSSAAILGSIMTAKLRRLDASMITGFLLGFALLTKSPAQIIAILLPLSFIFYPPPKINIIYVLKHLVLLVPIYLIAFGIYGILRLGPEFHMIALRNRDYVFSLGEVLSHPLNPLVSNLRISWSYLTYFLTLPIVFLSVLSLFIVKGKKPYHIFILAALPVLAQGLIAKVLTARYLLYITPWLIILAAVSLYKFSSNISLFRQGKTIVLTLLIVLILPIIYIVKLTISPESLNDMPQSERTGYFEIWTAGYGLKEVGEYLRIEAKTGKNILVGTEGYFGTLPDGLQMYLNGIENVRIIGIGLYPDKVPDPLTNSLVDNDVYLVINDSRISINNPKSEGLILIASYPKAINLNGQREKLLFFKVLPKPGNNLPKSAKSSIGHES